MEIFQYFNIIQCTWLSGKSAARCAARDTARDSARDTAKQVKLLTANFRRRCHGNFP